MLPFVKEKRKEDARNRNRDKYWKLTDEERQAKKDKSLAYYYANIDALKIKAKGLQKTI
jgi:ubiquinone biosynthesis protein UbiJ